MFHWNGVSNLTVKVMDQDVVSDDCNGLAVVALDGIPSECEQEITVPLYGAPSGSVTLRMTFFPDAEWK